LDEAARLFVFWLSARTQNAKQEVADTLDAAVRLLCAHLSKSELMLEETVVMIRSCLIQMAIERMTDVSVTPRELRRRLGIVDGDLVQGKSGRQ
jgi:intergrase/recombinase